MEHTSRRGFLAMSGTAVATASLSGIVGGRSIPQSVTFATYNIENLTTEQVQSRGDPQAAAAARVIQEVRPDVLALNELVNNRQASAVKDVPATPTNTRAFVKNYLCVPQREDLTGIEYPYVYTPPSNTGVHSGMDLDNDGTVDDTPGDQGYADDAYGFGQYPGQYALAIISRYPIETDAIRSFRRFRWQDMPDSEIVRDPTYDVRLTDKEADRFRLSSKTHVDVPIACPDTTVHTLLAHPTPPVFDGPENFNGKRCHDEIRLLADYADGASYVYDDNEQRGGLHDNASYVLLGDMNASPGDGETLRAVNTYFLDGEFNTRRFPTSPGGAQAGSPYLTAEFGQQVDYVLPSPDLSVCDSAVVWPSENANKRGLRRDVEAASDHRLVWADVAV
ncbi:endonuclease/exonuclease/phosphatase family protein [Halocatena pleomorpha]|uniref:Endonuclease/exonuclease/phosphatase family protein n=1 Tax=Halocatena pleomorpha TaxID=1785090 RepID=A0A3P3RFI6_9EURY|nr:endonuclease/exonuclease/phosphatase family protein [Halocatena pleomorpha]RRJ32192.1 endonuclease/exonuclease/phosphatase family protein [Halocatena pleomorpha]